MKEEDPDEAIERYRGCMQEREDEPLDPGTGLPLVKALLQLNEYAPEEGPPITEVVILSQNSPETGVRVLNSIREQDLDISRSAFTAGASVTEYLDAFDVDLFLTTDREWGVYVDLAFFLGGVDKGPVLESFNPHIFFDDQDVHVETASERVPTGKVFYRSDSRLRALQAERDEEYRERTGLRETGE